MPEENESPLAGVMAELFARLKGQAGDWINDISRLYRNMPPEDRKILKDWMKKIVPLVRCTPPSSLVGTLKVDLRYPINSDETIHVSDVPAVVILNTFEALDRGERF